MVSVRRGSFSDTRIAAWKIGSVSLGNVQTADGGTNFGVTAQAVGVVTALADTPIRLKAVSDPTTPVIQSDFVIRSV